MLWFCLYTPVHIYLWVSVWGGHLNLGLCLFTTPCDFSSPPDCTQVGLPGELRSWHFCWLRVLAFLPASLVLCCVVWDRPFLFFLIRSLPVILSLCPVPRLAFLVFFLPSEHLDDSTFTCFVLPCHNLQNFRVL